MIRSRLPLVLVITLLAFLQAAETHADRRRPARIIGTTLAGRIVDAADGSPVFGAKVNIQDRTFIADAQGRYEAAGLQPGTITVNFERWGYESASREVALQAGSNALDVTLSSRPVIQMTDATGASYRLDYDSAFFGTQAPLSSIVPLSPAEFCRQDGSIATYAKDQISRITSTGQLTEGGVCCPDGGPGVIVTVTPKGSPAFTATMQECRFYDYLFVARDRATGAFLYLKASSIRDLTFP